VTRLSTALACPDDVLVDQNDDTHDMYIIAKGECQVKITSNLMKLEPWKTLRPGDYFGEISMIYESKRTAQVMSVKYSTLAKLTNQRYRELLTEVPEITKDLKEGIFKIQDRNKAFMMQSLSNVPYF
jgi:CRP-like cAMP-binding protein